MGRRRGGKRGDWPERLPSRGEVGGLTRCVRDRQVHACQCLVAVGAILRRPIRVSADCRLSMLDGGGDVAGPAVGRGGIEEPFWFREGEDASDLIELVAAICLPNGMGCVRSSPEPGQGAGFDRVAPGANRARPEFPRAVTPSARHVFETDFGLAAPFRLECSKGEHPGGERGVVGLTGADHSGAGLKVGRLKVSQVA